MHEKTELDLHGWDDLDHAIEKSVTWQVLYLLQHYGRFVDIRKYDVATEERVLLDDWDYSELKLYMFKEVAEDYDDHMPHATFLDAVIKTIAKIYTNEAVNSITDPKLVQDRHGGIDSVHP